MPKIDFQVFQSDSTYRRSICRFANQHLEMCYLRPKLVKNFRKITIRLEWMSFDTLKLLSDSSILSICFRNSLFSLKISKNFTHSSMFSFLASLSGLVTDLCTISSYFLSAILIFSESAIFSQSFSIRFLAKASSSVWAVTFSRV